LQTADQIYIICEHDHDFMMLHTSSSSSSTLGSMPVVIRCFFNYAFGSVLCKVACISAPIYDVVSPTLYSLSLVISVHNIN